MCNSIKIEALINSLSKEIAELEEKLKVLENENLFMLKKGEGKETGALLEECLANELAVIEELSQIPLSLIHI